MKMKKENYVCLALGIIALTVWVVDILGFFKLTEIWEFVKGIYALFGLPVSLLCFMQAVAGTPFFGHFSSNRSTFFG